MLDHDTCEKLAKWFEARWQDRWCIDISNELEQIIQESWAREEELPPYTIYLKMAYHLCQEAREGLTTFRIPREFQNQLFDFQVAAVKIAAHHLNKRGGVLVGDVVGLGKTIMATALAKIFQDDYYLSTLILCPKNLVSMWENYTREYGLHAMIVPFSQAIKKLPEVPARFRLVLIDESHNLRNRSGKRYRAIQEYIRQSESKVILLTATPYNKTYLDLANQLRLFIPEDRDIGLRPENLLRDINEIEFNRRFQSPIRSLAAFEKSVYADDWRELMRLYMVRRTRSFIQDNYAESDDKGRKYLTFPDGTFSYFPIRQPRTIKFSIDDNNPDDQYAQLYATEVVDAINGLNLPRYGLGNYVIDSPNPTSPEGNILDDLSRAGKYLMGFCRTNLFKRLESSGQAFVQSVERHILRNYIYLHALENDHPLPIGPQDASMLDARTNDEDADSTRLDLGFYSEGDTEEESQAEEVCKLNTEKDFQQRAAQVYSDYTTQYKNRFKWLRTDLFDRKLIRHLRSDSRKLIKVLNQCGVWKPERDAKLEELVQLIQDKHPEEKLLVFTQFADTVRYLTTQLKARSIENIDGVTGDTSDPTALAFRFSPISNGKGDSIATDQELRILVSTDVLSEGQNLQDAAIVINYDLPWAIIRLIQRAGRVDRIGQRSDRILCYSFLPADGVERIIRLRSRVRQRLQENAEVVGTDEFFFEDDRNDQVIHDLFTEKGGILDGEDDAEIDLVSYAYQIWKNAIDDDPSLEKTIPQMPPVVYSSKSHVPEQNMPEGALVYIRTPEDNDALAWVDRDGKSVTESQFAILKAAECGPDMPAAPHHDNHHQMVRAGVEHIGREEKSVGGQLGRPSGARFRTYERLKNYAAAIKDSLFDIDQLHRAIEDIYRHPLTNVATDTLNRQLRSGVDDDTLARLVISLRESDRLSSIHKIEHTREPRIICSMGLVDPAS